MSRKPENQFIASVEKHMPPNAMGCYRMKNDNVFNAGIADKWYSGKHDLWVEYKFIVVPVRDRTMIDLVGGKDPIISDLQQKWLRERHAEGRDVKVIVGCKEGGVIFDPGEWDSPFETAAFKRWIIDRKAIASEILAFIN